MRQRGAAWELRVYVGRDPVTGHEHYATRTIRAGKREAQRVLNEMVVAAERGALVKTRSTLAELLDAWLEHAGRDFPEDRAGDARVHRTHDQTGSGAHHPRPAPADHARPVLRQTARIGWRSQPRPAVAGHCAARARHHPPSARSGGAVRLAWLQACGVGVGVAAASASDDDPAADTRRVGAPARRRRPSGPGAGNVSHGGGGHRRWRERTGRSALVGRRSRSSGHQHRAGRRSRPERARGEGHQDAPDPACDARRGYGERLGSPPRRPGRAEHAREGLLRRGRLRLRQRPWPDALVPGLGEPAVPQAQSGARPERRSAPRLSRPPSLRRDSPADCRGRRANGGRPARPSQRRDHAQRVLAFVPEAHRQAADVPARLLESERL